MEKKYIIHQFDISIQRNLVDNYKVFSFYKKL